MVGNTQMCPRSFPVNKGVLHANTHGEHQLHTHALPTRELCAVKALTLIGRNDEAKVEALNCA